MEQLPTAPEDSSEAYNPSLLIFYFILVSKTFGFTGASFQSAYADRHSLNINKENKSQQDPFGATLLKANLE